MKKIISILFISLFLFSCAPAEPGENYELFNAEKTNVTLPEELKGLKIYNISIGNNDYLKIALIDGGVAGISEEFYNPGLKYTETKYTIIVNQNRGKQKVIHAKEILSETDSIIVLKK